MRPAAKVDLRLKRAYDAPEPADGYRILVDRLWPRGVARSAARIDLWLREIAPSTALRKRFRHDPSEWMEFRDRYFEELDENPAAVSTVRVHLREGTVTLVYAAKNREYNNAVALAEYLSSPADGS